MSDDSEGSDVEMADNAWRSWSWPRRMNDDEVNHYSPQLAELDAIMVDNAPENESEEEEGAEMRHHGGALQELQPPLNQLWNSIDPRNLPIRFPYVPENRELENHGIRAVFVNPEVYPIEYVIGNYPNIPPHMPMYHLGNNGHWNLVNEAPQVNVSCDGWPGPARYFPLLTRLKERQSKLRNLQDLQSLCVKSVLQNLPYFTSKKRPFDYLPGDMLQVLMQHLDKENKLTPEVFPLLITNRTKYIKFRQDSSVQDPHMIFSTQQFSSLFRDISNKCSEVLTELHLHLNHESFMQMSGPDAYPSIADIDCTLNNMTNLRELTLHTGTANDVTIATVAINCMSIRVLQVANNRNVTDKGMKYLYGGDPPRSQNLEILDVSNTSVSYYGIGAVLEKLPNISDIKFDHLNGRKISEIVKIQKIKHKLKINRFDIEDDIMIKELSTVMEDVTHLKIGCVLRDVESLFNFKSIIQLTLDKEVLVSNNIKLIQHFGLNLTHLSVYLHKHETIDLNIIGYFCPNLQEFELECYQHIPDTNQYELNESHFSKLTKLNLSFSIERGRSNIPNNLVKLMLSAEPLQKLSISGYNINLTLISEILVEAKLHEKIFSNLEEVNFSKIYFENIHIIRELICLAPKLNCIIFENCNSYDAVASRDLKLYLPQFILYNKLTHLKCITKNMDFL